MSKASRFPFLVRLGLLALLAAPLASCGPNVAKADSYEQLADSMMSAGAYAGAWDAMEKSIKNDPNEPRRWIKLGRAQRAADQPALAATSYQRALDLDPANIEGLENMAILLVRAGRYDEAKGYVDPLMALQPDDIAGLLSLGAIAMFQQRFEEANKYADHLIQIAPSSIGGYTLKAHVLSAQGKRREAAAVLAQQVALNPNDPDLAQQVMDLYRASHNLEGIRKTAMVLANLFPDDPRYQMEKVRALHADGKENEANAVLAKIQQRYRGNPDVMQAVADYWLGSLPRDMALARIVDLTGRLGGIAKAQLGDLLIDNGHAPDTVRLLKADTAGEVTPDTTDLHATYARALLAIGKPDEARDAAQNVLNFDGSNTIALVVRAYIEFATHRYADALTDAQLALSNDHFNQEAALLIPQIYAAMDNKVLAEKAWGDAQMRLPHDPEVNQRRTAWLIAQGRRDDAMQIAGTFARGNLNDIGSWQLFHKLCVEARDECAERSEGQINAILDN